MNWKEKLEQLSWFVCYGHSEYLDDRGRVKDYKCYMPEKQAKYLEQKFGPRAQAHHEERK